MKYYVNELNISEINFNKLKNDLYYNENDKFIIVSDTGFYTIYNNQYYHNSIDLHHASNEDCYYKKNKYLDKYTLYIDNNRWRKKKVDSIPVTHKQLNLIEEVYKLNEKCNVSFVIEKTKKGEICDAYFLSHLDENNYSFQETMSYLLAKLI